MKPKRPIKVLIVDDSALVRSMLTRGLSGEPDIEVVGGAIDPFHARELIIKHRPHVIILDIAMPRMDGLTFLKKLMVHYPVPVIMCSGVAGPNTRIALEAIECGAIDVVAKPNAGTSKALRHLAEDLAEKIRAASIANSKPPPRVPASAEAAPTSFGAAGLDPNQHLVVIGASTGGTEAIKQLLERVPPDFPPVVIVQHMPEGFTKSFADRLDQFSAMSVKEAEDEDVLTPGKAFVARGGTQMMVRASGTVLRIAYGSDEPVNRHCPAVDVLFDSAAHIINKKKLIGILLTGMGADGAKGLLNLKNAGAVTATQSQRSCVVYGMPKVADDLGASMHHGAPGEIPGIIINALRRKASASHRKPTSAVR